ncbi:MAG TPA: response regulator transcription factor [Saprospiraceae bacterium]|nr:response regulator transcription factor [Saprospiraceae bacterium]
MDTRIAIAEDTNLICRGIAEALHLYSDVKIIFECSYETELLAKLKMHNIDVIILDLNLTEWNSLKTLIEIRRTDLLTKIIILSFNENRNEIIRYWNEKVNGHLIIKGITTKEIYHAIKECHNNGSYFDSFSQQVLFQKLQSKSNYELTNISSILNLNETEKRIIELVIAGSKSKDIAIVLKMSTANVSRIRGCLLVRSGTKNTAEFVKVVIDNNLIDR